MIHHFGKGRSLALSESWGKAKEDLGKLEKRIRSEISIVEQRLSSPSLLAEASKNPEIQRDLLYGHLRDQLCETLDQAASQSIDSNGWTSLKPVIASDPLLSSQLIPDLLEGYKASTLTHLLKQFGGYELQHVKGKKGKHQIQYRILTIYSK